MTGASAPRARSPREHLLGALDLFDALHAFAGPTIGAADLRTEMDSPELLPDRADGPDLGLKYDAYLSPGADGLAWGATMNDRWQQPGMPGVVQRLAGGWGLDLRPYQLLREQLLGASPELTLSGGFAPDGAPPRLKLYLQESRWGAGVATVESLQAAARACLGTDAFPPWLDQKNRVGVTTIDFQSGKDPGLKFYLGGSSPGAVSRSAPQPVQDLARRMAEASPAPGGWYYLTVRLTRGEPARYSINKIYNPSRLIQGGQGALDRAWSDVSSLFDAAGRQADYQSLRAVTAGLGSHFVCPTASALDQEADRADVYCAAWARPGPTGATTQTG